MNETATEAARRVGWARYYATLDALHDAHDDAAVLRYWLDRLCQEIITHNRLHHDDPLVQAARILSERR